MCASINSTVGIVNNLPKSENWAVQCAAQSFCDLIHMASYNIA
jgi:hypothetical protein